ncbi:MAG: UDP-N-acetylglucosamine-peptide N-acetylglucosaminyltransferase [Candidatus Competibacteraceae bacterium]
MNYEFRRLEHGDWQDYEYRITTIRRLTEECLERGEPSPLLPFRALFLPISQELRLAIARRESERLMAAAVSGVANGAGQYADGAAKRLKIGYLSADFHEHPTAHLMRGFFHCHDRHRFEIYGYALRGEADSAYYQRIKNDCDHFVDLSNMDNAAAVRRIQADGIHVLVDLMVYTNYSRPEIFCYRPAPIQINWLGFPGSSGAKYLDYVIVDPVVLPPEQAVFCTEQPIYLPECYQVNDRWQEIAETGIQRVDQNLPEQGFVFCCFNQIQKLEPAMFSVWMRILLRVSDSVLWLYSESEEAQENLRAAAAACGVAGERLVFAKRLPKDRHLERHRLADLFLDTRIYGAHTTASDALWAGLPVLTCLGEAFSARVAASLLHAVGLPELITHSLVEYEERAVRLATQPTELAALRDKLAYNRLRTPLFDTERFTRHLERAYELMWERDVQGLPPAPLHVSALPSREPG